MVLPQQKMTRSTLIVLALALGCASAAPLDAIARVIGVSSATPSVGGPIYNSTKVTMAPGQYLEGKSDPSTGQRHFMGVPFAAPPVGNLRWRAPQPAESWQGARAAVKPGDMCWQSAPSAYGISASEDCLYLNVFAPSEDTVAAVGPLPVMVFWHGGSWDSGSGSCPLYYGQHLVETSGEAVSSIRPLPPKTHPPATQRS